MSTKVVYRKDRRQTPPELCVAVPLRCAVVWLFTGEPAVAQAHPAGIENRKAAPFPAFSVSTLLDGSWQSGFSRWMQDQFAFRDAAVNTQRAADEVLFQKVEEGGILLGKDHWMFTKLFTVDDATKKQLDKIARQSAILPQITRAKSPSCWHRRPVSSTPKRSPGRTRW